MSVATSTAIALGVGAASAGASAYGAHKASSAAKDAAKIQGASADRAQAFNERVYQQQRQDLNPYMTMGSDSLARLFSQHWGTPYQPQQPQGMPNGGGAVPRGSLGFGQPSMGAGQLRMGSGQPAMGGGPALGSMPGAPMMLRAPSGETMPVHDPQEAQRLIGLGAERVG